MDINAAVDALRLAASRVSPATAAHLEVLTTLDPNLTPEPDASSPVSPQEDGLPAEGF